MDPPFPDAESLLDHGDCRNEASSFSATSAADTYAVSPISPPEAHHRRSQLSMLGSIVSRADSQQSLPPYEAAIAGAVHDRPRSSNQGLGISALNQDNEKTASYSSSLTRNTSFRTFVTESLRSSSAPSILPLALPSDQHYKDLKNDGLGTPDILHERGRSSPRLRANMILLALSVFSTWFSAVYLVVAVVGPIYGGISGTEKGVTVSTVSTLIALFAKLIELSFITVFTAFIGQMIWRRAHTNKEGRGITLAQLSMRNWITQPGAIMTNAKTFRYGVMSLLGLLSLVAAISAMLYTTASNSLVSPQLKFGNWQDRVMAGLVQTGYGNNLYIADHCQTPITNDPADGASACIEIEHTSQSYPNFKQFLTTWTTLGSAGNVSTEQKDRPRGTGTINNDTSVLGSWVDVLDMEKASLAAGRIMQNVSYALPHSGVYQAVSWAKNQIPQPTGLEGLNAFSLYASVPAAVLHVLCVNISAEELAPMIYSTWPSAQTPVDTAIWPEQVPIWSPTEWLNATAVDDIFEFGPKYGQRRPPVFSDYPNAFNTMFNSTGVTVGRDAVYLLARGGPDQGGDFSLCSLKSSITPFCSTRMNATSVGTSLESYCEDDDDALQYIKSNPGAASGSATINNDWVDVATDWGLAMSLNDGLVGANSSTARILAQLIPRSAALSPVLPSLAETLAVLAGCTAIISTQNASFVPFWNYTNPNLTAPVLQYFNASYISQQYAAGGGASNGVGFFHSGSTGQYGYQRGFFIVLIAVFACNAFVLGWFLLNFFQKKWVVDFSEPAELFNLAIYSPTPPPAWKPAGNKSGGRAAAAAAAGTFTANDEKKRKKDADAETTRLTRNWVLHERGDRIILEQSSRSSPSPSSLSSSPRWRKKNPARSNSRYCKYPVDPSWFEHRRSFHTQRIKRKGIREDWRRDPAGEEEDDDVEDYDVYGKTNRPWRRWWRRHLWSWPFSSSSTANEKVKGKWTAVDN